MDIEDKVKECVSWIKDTYGCNTKQAVELIIDVLNNL